MRTRGVNVRVMLSLIAMLALGCASAFAQTPAGQQPPPPPPRGGTGPHEGFGIQIAGGPIFASLDDVNGTNFSSKAGWLVGLAMGGNRGGVVGVEADVLYGKKGAKLNIPGVGDFEQQVVHVPVMLKLNAGSGNVNGLSVFGVGGGFFDWQFDSKVGSNPADNTNGYEVGWVLGGGVEVLRFSVQARYMKGLREISKEFDVVNSQESKSKGFLILFAFRLN